MANSRVLTASVDTYPAQLSQLQNSPAPHYILFSCDEDLTTGKRWCPDCERAVPVVKAVAASKPGTLLEVSVGDRAAWKHNPTHPFRVDPQLQVKGIPTLVQWGVPGKRLASELENCATPEAVEELLDKTNFFAQ